MRVCVDAGHGGRDSGSTFPQGEEKEFALAASKVAHSLLVHAGHEVLATREDDEFVGLGRRASMANGWGADCFLSFHWNAAARRVPSGTQVLHHKASEEGHRLAHALLEEIAPLDGETAERWERTVGLPDTSYRATPDGSPFVPTVLSKTVMPAVIIEVEFGSNPEDVELMLRADYQVKLGRAVVRALEKWQEEREPSEG